jgi:hypothetical protein
VAAGAVVEDLEVVEEGGAELTDAKTIDPKSTTVVGLTCARRQGAHELE